MQYCTRHGALSDHDIGDLERMCKLRLWHNWATVASFTQKECGKIPGISCTCRDSNWGCPKSVGPDVFLLGRACWPHISPWNTNRDAKC
jgi:hypothetical protein